jgi:hypothetical protein
MEILKAAVDYKDRWHHMVPSREWLEFEGGVISALFQPTEWSPY